MAGKKVGESGIRKLVKVGGGTTYSITIPIEIIRELGWKTRQKLIVKKYGNGILISDWKAPNSKEKTK